MTKKHENRTLFDFLQYDTSVERSFFGGACRWEHDGKTYYAVPIHFRSMGTVPVEQHNGTEAIAKGRFKPETKMGVVYQSLR
jgi:hypothetical protein